MTDIYFPGQVHGFALARMSRMRLGLKVLYVTGFDVPESEAVGKILHKPFSVEQLIDAVRLALADVESKNSAKQIARSLVVLRGADALKFAEQAAENARNPTTGQSLDTWLEVIAEIKRTQSAAN